jgi:hypothetical protein
MEVGGRGNRRLGLPTTGSREQPKQTIRAGVYMANKTCFVVAIKSAAGASLRVCRIESDRNPVKIIW